MTVGAITAEAATAGTTGEFEGAIAEGALSTITGVTSFTGIVVGTELSDSATGKVIAAGTKVTAKDTTAKTITLSKPATAKIATQKFTYSDVYGAAGAENLYINLQGTYNNAKYFIAEQNLVTFVEKPKLVVQVEDSVDGGNTYFATEGIAAHTEAVETSLAASVIRADLSAKPHGVKFRLKFKFGAKGAVAGQYTIVTIS